jgi:hypothetical protein
MATDFQYQSSYNLTGLTVTMMSQQGQPLVTGIPPWYCASQAGAVALQSWLAANGVTTKIQMGWPLFQQTSGNLAVQSAQVPFLADGKGAVENAGGLLWNFNNLPSSLAAQMAIEAFSLDDTQPGS